jgi:hypothetical protein
MGGLAYAKHRFHPHVPREDRTQSDSLGQGEWVRVDGQAAAARRRSAWRRQPGSRARVRPVPLVEDVP